MLSNRDASQMITPHNWGVVSSSQKNMQNEGRMFLTTRSVFLFMCECAEPHK